MAKYPIILRDWNALPPEEYKLWEEKAREFRKKLDENPLLGLTPDPELASFMGLPLPRDSDSGYATKEDAIRSWIGVERNEKGVPIYVGTEEDKKRWAAQKAAQQAAQQEKQQTE